jgi:hypothetical protein
MQLVTESSPWWIIGCLLLGATYAFLLYQKSDTFPKRLRLALAVFRALSVSLLAFLLLSPLIRTLSREKEKPIVVIAADNSESIAQSDSLVARQKLPEIFKQMKSKLDEKFEVHLLNFSDRVEEGKPLDYSGQQTDYSTLVDELNTRYVNRNVGAVIVASDGLFNKGGNPVYRPLDFATTLYTIPLGDTVVRKDLVLSSVNFNKIVYLGNAFPLEVVVDARQCNGSNFTLLVKQDSSLLFSRSITASGNRYRVKVPVVLDAKKKGLMRLKLSLSELSGEVSYENNIREIFVEVRESKEKVLIIANAPHPDLGTLKTLLESSQNYQVAIKLMDDDEIKIGENNLVVFHNLPSDRYNLENIFKTIRNSGLPALFILGSETNLSSLAKLSAGLAVVTSTVGKSNAVLPSLNSGFSLFTLDENVKEKMPQLPPLFAPFGEYKMSGVPTVLCYQQIGAVRSAEPLIFFTQQDQLRTGFICGEGIWRWPMSEYSRSGEATVSRELVIKMVQYLSVKDGRSKFRILIKNSFNENEPVLVDAEVFNDNYELINTPEVSFDVTDASGKQFPFLFSRGDRSYSLNACFLSPGDYRYTATAQVGDRKSATSGVFSVAEIRAEQTETVADHGLLSAWAAAFGGKSYSPDQADNLVDELLKNDKLKTISYSQVKLQDLINLKLVFALLLLLLSVEWLLRKRAGSY